MISDAGKNRLIAGAFFGLAAFSIGTAAQAQENCALKVEAGLDIHTMPSGTISVPVKIEDRNFFFEIDTGGYISTIDPQIAHAMNLRARVGGARMAGIGNASTDLAVFPKSFSIGKLTSKDVWFLAATHTEGGIGGTVAPEFLRSYDVDLDFAGGKFNLISSDHCPGKVVYWTHGPVAIVPMTISDGNGHIHVPVKVDGKEIQATIDTGATFSIMAMTASRTYTGIGADSAGLTPQSLTLNGRLFHVYSYPFKTIDFAGVSVANPYILILQDSDMRFLGSDLILGMSTLRQLHMYIAYKEGKIYLTSATAH